MHRQVVSEFEWEFRVISLNFKFLKAINAFITVLILLFICVSYINLRRIQIAMYKIERQNYGVKLTFDGFIDPEEMQTYKDEFKAMLDLLPPKFGLLGDMRNLKPLPPESQAILSAHPEWTASRIVRSATIIDSALVKMQSRRLSKEWNQQEAKRYIDASQHANWEAMAEEWIVDGVEPQ